MHIRDGRHEADRFDTGGVRESGGAVDEREPGDRSPIQTEEIQSFIRAVDIGRPDERRGSLLHLDDDRQQRQRTLLHQRPQRGIDLVRERRLGARGWPCRYKDEHERDEHAADAHQRVSLHA